jgi:hypothetical protein
MTELFGIADIFDVFDVRDYDCKYVDYVFKRLKTHYIKAARAKYPAHKFLIFF